MMNFMLEMMDFVRTAISSPVSPDRFSFASERSAAVACRCARSTTPSPYLEEPQVIPQKTAPEITLCWVACVLGSKMDDILLKLTVSY